MSKNKYTDIVVTIADGIGTIKVSPALYLFATPVGLRELSYKR
jgi:hypothetical protein